MISETPVGKAMERDIGKVMTAVAFLVGPVGVLAPKGLVVIVVVAGSLGFLHWISAGRPAVPVPRTLLAILAAFFGWCAVTAVWAPVPWRAVTLPVKLVALTAAGTALVHLSRSIDGGERKAVANALVAGTLCGLGILLAGLVYARVMGDSLWGEYFNDPLTTMNTGAVVVSLLLWPVVAIFWHRRRRRGSALLVAATVGLLSFLSSGAALVAAGLGGVAVATVYAFGRRGGVAIAVLLGAMILVTPPVIGWIPDADRVSEAVPALAPSAEHRLHMWKFVNERIDENSVFGWGMDSARSIPQQDRRLAPSMEIMPLHPHNAALQVRLELGLPGAAIAAVLVFYLLFIATTAPTGSAAAAFRVGTATGYMVVGAFSYGVWQNWWVALAWCLAALLCAVNFEPVGDDGTVGAGGGKPPL